VAWHGIVPAGDPCRGIHAACLDGWWARRAPEEQFRRIRDESRRRREIAKDHHLPKLKLALLRRPAHANVNAERGLQSLPMPLERCSREHGSAVATCRPEVVRPTEESAKCPSGKIWSHFNDRPARGGPRQDLHSEVAEPSAPAVGERESYQRLVSGRTLSVRPERYGVISMTGQPGAVPGKTYTAKLPSLRHRRSENASHIRDLFPDGL